MPHGLQGFIALAHGLQGFILAPHGFIPAPHGLHGLAAFAMQGLDATAAM